MILLIDNYDSFSHNLARYITLACEQPVQTLLNDEISAQELQKLQPNFLILSPGPGNPDQAGISLAAIKYFKDKCPILGVCLGHQCIGQYFGARITQASKILHGKTSEVFHSADPIFTNISNPFTATRYHSLVIEQKTLPEELCVIASSDNEIMAIKHRNLPIYGLQFHPEAYLTDCGHTLIENFFRLTPHVETNH